MARRPQSFASRLLAWFDANRRDLPWRRTSDPWAIWVSEIMLQQTRVEAVRGAYEAFLERYPTPASFAAVDDDELLTAWRGLGYYRRARLLREGARAVVREHSGIVPDELTMLGSLPGIGEYTRGAIASIAFGQVVPAVDGNVERVFARHRTIDTNVKAGPGKRAVRAAVLETLPTTRPGDFNQAVMELGATVCTPRSPDCGRCPIATDCAATAAGRVEELPVLPKRRDPVEVHARAAVIERRGGTVLGHRITAGAINAGQVDLLGPGPLISCSAAQELAASLFERFGLKTEIGPEIATVRHTITHHRITLTAHRATVLGRLPRDLVTARPDDPAIPWTTLARKIITRAGIAAGG